MEFITLEQAQELVGQIKDWNTRQEVALEADKPRRANCQRYVAELSKITVETADEYLLPHLDEMHSLLEKLGPLIQDGTSLSRTERQALKNDVLSKLNTIITKMYQRMESDLNEARS